MSGNAFGMAASNNTVRWSVVLVGSYAAVLCWIGAALAVVSIPGFAFSLGWFLVPPALLTIAVWMVWLQGRERQARREPRHIHVGGRHVVRPSSEPAERLPRSPLSRSLLAVSCYTAALAWGGLFAMAWNGVAFVLGSVVLIVPLVATLFALFAWAYRGHPRADMERA